MLGQEVRNYDGTPTTYSPQPNNFLDAFQTGFGTNTNIALEGGTEKSTFRLSYNHNQGEGIVRKINSTKMPLTSGPPINLQKQSVLMQALPTALSKEKTRHGLAGWMHSLLTISANYLPGYLPRNYDTKYWMQKEHYTSIFGGAPDLNDPNEPNKAPESRFWFNLFENKYLSE